MNSTAFIHKTHLLDNISAIKSRLKSGVQIMAVIKDNAYGHGILGVARCLEPKVDWFCVARADEGIRLREHGIKKPILVFEIPQAIHLAAYPNYQLTASLADIDSFESFKPGTEFHINLDTGMRRIGILPEDVPRIIQKLGTRSDVKATGIYTHFAKADDPNNPEVEIQLDQFKALKSHFPKTLLSHTANTGAIFHYPNLNLQFDAVRPGVSLFGYGAGEIVIEDLKPVLEWNSFLMQVKSIKKGEAVSYGGRWIAPSDGFLGVVPVGYSAGIRRLLSSQIEYLIEGKKYPQVGTISMDYSMVFLGKDKLETGAKVTLLNANELTAKKWAENAQTIPYEITTGIHPLIERTFI